MALTPPDRALDIRHFDLSDVVREAFESGCECDACGLLRHMAETNELQHRRFSTLRFACYVAAVMGTLAVLLIFADLLFLRNP